MRTESSEDASNRISRPGSPLERLRYWFAAQSAPMRRRIALGAFAVVLAAVYVLATSGTTTTVTTWLDGGREFSAEESRSVGQALTARGLRVTTGPRGQLGVPSEQASEAMKVLEEQGLVRRTLEQLVDEPVKTPLWVDPFERDQVRRRRREQKIEAVLEGFDELISATVLLQESDPRRFGDEATRKATVFVTLKPPGLMTTALLERVEATLLAMEHELRRGQDVTVMDSAGHIYLEAGDPAVAMRTRAGVKAHEWETALNRRLGELVRGSRVSVRMEFADEPDSGAPAREPAAKATANVVPNAPLTIDEPPPTEAAPTPVALANVLVEVPAQYFLERYHGMAGIDKMPTQAELQPMIDQTSELIENVIRYEIPKDQLGQLEIVKIPLTARPRPAQAASAQPRIDWRPWWAGAAVLAGIVLAVAATAGGRMAFHRRSASPARGQSPRDRFDHEDRAGPSDRVRELVRRDPEAAASVLRRWVVQGELTP